MQILGAAHLFSWLIGYEFYRNDRISNLGVITGGTQINRAVCANVEEFGNLSCRFTQTWFLLMEICYKIPEPKGFSDEELWWEAVLVPLSDNAKVKSFGGVLVESGPSSSEIHSYG